MKTIPVILVLLCFWAALSGCSKQESAKLPEPGVPAAIEVRAGVETVAQTRADLSGVISGTAFPANTTKVFSVVGYSGTAVPTSWSSPYIDNIAVNSGEGSALSFAAPQYYPANGNKVYFYGYSPVNGTYTAGSGATTPTVAWTITGKQDIMWAKVDQGIAKNPLVASQEQPSFTFNHLLKQVKFKIVKDNTFEDNVKLTSLKIVGAKTKVAMALNTGTLSWEDATSDLTAYGDASGQAITGTAAVVGSVVMFEPGTSFKVQVTAGGVTYADVMVTLSGTNAGAAGVSHEVTLTFKRNAIVPTATITDWQAGTEAGAYIL